MAVADLSCLVCQQPAIIVLSARIDAGIVHYPACAVHVPDLGRRLIGDAGKAVGNLLTTRHADAIDVEAQP